MKAKRIVAFCLVALLQIGACLLLVGNGSLQARKIEREGESYRFAIHSVTAYRSDNRTFVNIDFPPVLPMPEAETDADTTVYMIEVGEDGLARQRLKGVSFAQAEQMPDLARDGIYNIGSCRAVPDVSADVPEDLERLNSLMYDLQADVAASVDGTLSDSVRDRLLTQAQEIGNPTLRGLAQRQIEAENGDELFDSYVTGILYRDKLYPQDLYVAGLHIASLQSP